MKIASAVGRSKIEDYAFLSDTQSGALVVAMVVSIGFACRDSIPGPVLQHC